MAGKKQKRQANGTSLADALTATRSARRRVLAIAARLEGAERAILAAMAPAPRPAAAATGAVKRPVGRPRKSPQAAPAPATATGRGTAPRTTATRRTPARPKA